MKTRYFSAIIAMCVSVGAFSQADDLYFVPTKKGKEVKQEKNIVIKERTVTVTNDDRDVDEYNRRVSYDDSYDNDTLYLDEGYDVTTDNYESDEEYAYSRRLLRFHSPTVGVYVSSPYYWDVYYSPWGWNSLYWDSWYWNGPYYAGGWYSPGWSFHWHSSWYAPWWHRPPHWGWHHGPHWGWNRPHYRPPYYHRPGVNRPSGQTHRVYRGTSGGRVWTGGNNYRSRDRVNHSSNRPTDRRTPVSSDRIRPVQPNRGEQRPIQRPSTPVEQRERPQRSLRDNSGSGINNRQRSITTPTQNRMQRGGGGGGVSRPQRGRR